MVEMRPTPADDPLARELLTEYFAERAATFPGQYTPAFPERGAFQAPAGVFLAVVNDAGEPMGCGGIRRIADGPLGSRYEVKHLYLRPAARGNGWGRALLDELMRRARVWHADELVLDTHDALEAAGGLYTAAGFTQIEPYNENPNATRWYGRLLR